MITIDQLNLLQQLQNIAKLSVKHKESHFLSYITPIHDAPDILSIFANGLKVDSKLRSFWSDSEGLTLVGVGGAFNCEANGRERFKKVKKEWDNLSHRMIKNIDKKGTGPLAMGGFSFNEMENQTSEWSHFPGAALTIPRYLITENGEETWLTININVPDDLNVDETYNQVMKEIRQLLDFEESQYRALPQITAYGPETKDAWLHTVNQVVNRIHSGEVKKVVMSRVLDAQMADSVAPEALIESLLKRRTYGFVFCFERNGHCFVGASPERLVKCDGSLVYCDCLAGTEARGVTKEEDEALGNRLLKDEKNLGEHQFVVEMIKGAMESFAVDVIAPEKPRIVKAESVQHLYTPVSGWLKSGITLFDAIEQLHPTPAMGGTPRNTALSIIEYLEPHDRGWYAAPVGWVDECGNGDFAVGIRSCLIRDHSVRLFAGCGIVKDSNPEKEYKETKMKFRPILNALEENLK